MSTFCCLLDHAFLLTGLLVLGTSRSPHTCSCHTCWSQLWCSQDPFPGPKPPVPGEQHASVMPPSISSTLQVLSQNDSAHVFSQLLCRMPQLALRQEQVELQVFSPVSCPTPTWSKIYCMMLIHNPSSKIMDLQHPWFYQ